MVLKVQLKSGLTYGNRVNQSIVKELYLVGEIVLLERFLCYLKSIRRKIDGHFN